MNTITKSYWSVHDQLQTTRGKASDHTCKCGKPALDWAFRGDDSTALISTIGTGIGRKYSEDLGDYHPECRSCHHKGDMTEEKRATYTATLLAVNAGRDMQQVGSHWGTEGSKKTNAMQRKCLNCGMVSTPGPMTLHQQKTGHTGLENVA